MANTNTKKNKNAELTTEKEKSCKLKGSADLCDRRAKVGVVKENDVQ